MGYGRCRVTRRSRGRGAATRDRQAAQLAFEVSGGTLQAHPIELAAAGDDSVLGYFHFEASRPGASLDQDGLQRIVVRNGKIVSLHNMFADVEAADAFYQ